MPSYTADALEFPFKLPQFYRVAEDECAPALSPFSLIVPIQCLLWLVAILVA